MGFATAEGTARYASRFSHRSFYRQAQDLTVSSLGIGSYLGNMDRSTSKGYTAACVAALRGGINFLDTSLNYRNQESERSFGAALKQLLDAGEVAREEVVICTKGGYFVPDAVPERLRSSEIVGGMHSIAPAFLVDQLERSRANLGIGSIDVYYVHNPETQLSDVPHDELYTRLLHAFHELEYAVSKGKIRYYGAATWSGFRTADAEEEGLSLFRMEELARQVAGDNHHFRFIQLPFNLAMTEGATLRREHGPEGRISTVEAARRLGITVVASASLLQARLAAGLPGAVHDAFPGLSTDAQRAIQFARSTDGITAALAGMSKPAHVAENLGVASVPPADPSSLPAWSRLSR